MRTPSAPFEKASRMNCGSTRPEHITRIMRAFGACLNRETPARSAAVYVHQLQKNATMRGSQEFAFGCSSAVPISFSPIHYSQQTAGVCSSRPLISLKIISSSNKFCLMEPDGHAATHVPHPLQSASLIYAFCFTSSREIAL